MSTNRNCHFGTDHYREILEMGLKHGYRFVSFDEIPKIPKGVRACVVRHDVDYMPEWSPRFAKIEKELGIQSAFFFQVCAKTYNLREMGNYRAMHEVKKLGHTVGLHFDWTWNPEMKWEGVAKECGRDKAVFKAIAGFEPCELVSFHNPHRYVDSILNRDIPGMRHTYEKRYFSDIKYISDSQGWYEGCMCRLFETGKYEKFQFLTHPYIWPLTSNGDFIKDMARMVLYRAQELLQYLIDYHPVCKKNEARLREEANAPLNLVDHK